MSGWDDRDEKMVQLRVERDRLLYWLLRAYGQIDSDAFGSTWAEFLRLLDRVLSDFGYPPGGERARGFLAHCARYGEPGGHMKTTTSAEDLSLRPESAPTEPSVAERYFAASAVLDVEYTRLESRLNDLFGYGNTARTRRRSARGQGEWDDFTADPSDESLEVYGVGEDWEGRVKLDELAKLGFARVWVHPRVKGLDSAGFCGPGVCDCQLLGISPPAPSERGGKDQ